MKIENKFMSKSKSRKYSTVFDGEIFSLIHMLEALALVQVQKTCKTKSYRSMRLLNSLLARI